MTDLLAPTVHDPDGGSRRSFLVGAAGLTAGAGVLAAAQAVGAAPSPGAATAVGGALDAAATTSGALVAYVRDLAGGEIAVMRGDTEVVVVDHELARALARLVG